MPKNYNNNIYQTTAFDQYPTNQRLLLIEKRKHIIDIRLRSQSHFNYPETAEFLWIQSEIAAKELQEWIIHNPPPICDTKHKQSLFGRLAQFIDMLLFRHQYAE